MTITRLCDGCKVILECKWIPQSGLWLCRGCRAGYARMN